ncbi:hypothetical protein O181_011029 [Austropuccinia psidii MF-1]|uniref:Uncharacterized protein n=1 Tax=Austropuccinia psidii MF-1 TaxID=1389203 RepID=A0A9Q3BS56_9BASI|nr:hypothetical protein [Austropuccinia psidii MF-1]
MLTPHMQHPSSGSAEISPFDVDYIPTSKIPSELDIGALSDPPIKEKSTLQNGFPSHSSLKATGWVLLYKVYIPFLTLSQQMSLDEHNSPNTQRKMGQSEELAKELAKNTFHFISAINIATSCTVSMDDLTAFSEHWKKLPLFQSTPVPKTEK